MYVSMMDVVTDANPADPGDRDDARDPGGPDDPEDAAAFARYSDELADAVIPAIGPWVERSVARLVTLYRGAVDDGERAAAQAAGRTATAELGPELRALLATDLDAQATTPLAIVRRGVRYPTEVLRAAGVPPVVRDAFAASQFPDDDYDLAPATLADLDPALAEIGLTWGAAKAHLHLARRRREGRR